MKQAVVMAAGEGTRLRPLTERWPKPILPIDGRPVIATLLRELSAAGIEQAFVVTGYRAEQVEQLVGDGAGFGLDVRYVRQPAVLGSADTVLRALAAGAKPPLLVTAADTVYSTGDVAVFVEQAADFPAALGVRRDPPRPGVKVSGGLVEEIVYAGETPYGSAPLWALGAEAVPLLEGLPGPPYELADVFRRALAAKLPVGAIEIGKTRDLTYAVDVVRENFPYLGP